MLSRVATSLTRTVASKNATKFAALAPSASSSSSRFMTTLEESPSAKSAWEKSCYFEMDFTVPEEATVYEAVQKFAAYDVGCLVTTDANGDISGVISERDYVSKIALLGRKSKETKVKEISTKTSNLMVAHPEDSVDDCMQKMLSKDIRHLPLIDEETGKVMGMLSVKDLVKSLVKEKEETIKVLSDFALGKGGHFGSE
mmetsp:Transcript_10727/g.13563  ORF Transcript_10727/g.13563 Transcript_10727/m.13563 type:complete len:199 (-) Transcript_10727:485-1081(-)|eukprot:CAMPEP_0203647476 /NCGR_PEP_ID=MMETSP0088-20131115/15838_1 /ASSEMBLY_ACC=CAM_ASM_001087 /TAXON_ID=426623 /ORGANISM="Chaetoceros affinis, Strain CCMP159" /LENGTH=198 /DNA_ID=CAMNT_0050505115 /DNA_START=36 /DNA_END=632 /DNA_ORIENTATION=-